MLKNLLKALFPRSAPAPREVADPAVLLRQADAAVREGRWAAAEQIGRELIADPAHEADARHVLSVVAYQGSDPDKALSLVDSSIALEPDAAPVHNTRGKILAALGRFDDATAAYERAMALAPRSGGYYLNYASAKKFSAADLPLIEAVEQRLTGSAPGSEDRINFQFALGKAFDDCGLHDRAFPHFREANEARFRMRPFMLPPFAGYVGALRDVFSRDFFARHARAADEGGGQPVFIIGMPRSGSTLVETLLCRDPAIVAGGELLAMDAVVDEVPQALASALAYPQCVRDAAELPLRELAEAYRDRLPPAVAAASRFTDKYPYNFLNVGLIALLFPRAAIIHVRRHPLDVCLSCYFTAFAHAHEYTNDINTLCGYYGQYERMMAHWHEALPGRIVDVEYEALASAPDDVIGAVRERAGLGAQPASSGPAPAHAVRTASAWQVRQPVYRSSVHRWRKYRNHVAPFVDALRSAGVTVDPGPDEAPGSA